MRRRRRQAADQADVNLTPMLDVVFILLIFFIVTATFLSEAGIDMRPPPPSDEENDNQENDVILIQVDGDNNVFVNQEGTVAERALAAVQRYRAESPNAAVLLEVEEEADHGVVVFIYDDMNANEIPVLIQLREDEE